MTWRSIRSISALLLLGAAALQAQPRYVRSEVRVPTPAVTLIDSRGERVPLAAALDAPGPVVLQFIFTTCPAVCPMLSGSLAGAQGEMGEKTRLVSISIDPEYDTPARLREYARRLKAGPRWRFLTGDRDGVAAVQKAFGAWRPNKMSHEPLTFLRAAPGEPWVRLAGPVTAADLIAEHRRLAGR
ncbi:MAG TPA: SCO family protein [Thermoanaerobaculia bacterium]